MTTEALERPLTELARPIFKAWERRRLLYNGLLVPATYIMLRLLVEPNEQISAGETVVTLALGGVFANVCFFAGPAVETYAAWLGYERPWFRGALFWAGTLFTAALAFLTVAALSIPSGAF